jgi:hypothetical protein
LLPQVAAGRLALAVILHPSVLEGVDAGPVTLLPTWALTPATLHPDDGEPLSLHKLGPLPVAVRPRPEAPAARDLFLDTLALHRPTGGTVVVNDERAALAMTAAGQAILITPDPTLHAPGVTRHRLTDDPLPLRLRLIWSRTPALHLAEALPHLATALEPR